MLKLIKGYKDETEKEYREKRKKKAELYFKNFAKKAVSPIYADSVSAMFYGVKYINFYDLVPSLDYYELRRFFRFICLLKNIMRKIAVKDLIAQFPIIKDYSGKKFECKDYFSTIEYLQTIDEDKPIGEELDNFLWNYYNQDLMQLAIKETLVIDRLRKYEGKSGIMEEWADMMGIDTFTIHEDEGYIYNRRTMTTKPLKKPMPKHLRVVKYNDKK